MSIEKKVNHLSRKGEYMTASIVICNGGEFYFICNVQRYWKEQIDLMWNCDCGVRRMRKKKSGENVLKRMRYNHIKEKKLYKAIRFKQFNDAVRDVN